MIDRLGRDITYLRISLTDKCNLRCRYCMPEEGVCKRSHHEMMNEDEIVTAVEVAASLGIRKIRLTGGEPLVTAASTCHFSTFSSSLILSIISINHSIPLVSLSVRAD